MFEAERLRSLARAPLLAWRLGVEGRYDFIYDKMALSMRSMSWAKRANVFRAGLNLVHRRPRPWAMPLHMQFELTSYCNLRCPVCPTGAGELQRRARKMDVGLFEEVFSEVGPYLLTTSLWGWGESLLHPQLGRFLSIVGRYPVVSLLSTNGQNLNQESVIEQILAAPPTYLIVALDGLSDETNSQFRVGARLAPALEGVRRLAELRARRGLAGPVLHMRFMVMRHNEHELAAAPAFAKRHGFDMLTTRMLSIVDSSSANLTQVAMMPEQEQFRAGRQAEKWAEFRCMHPFWFPSVFADGRLVLCEQDAQATAAVGQLGAGLRFRQAWQSVEAARRRGEIRDTPEEFSFCRSCPQCDRGAVDCSVGALHFRGGLEPLVVKR